METKLTVVTTTYNQEKYIEKCIDSIVKQKTNFRFKLVISDDNSTDNTRSIIEKYQKEYPDIIKPIYREKNLGPMNNFIETLNSIHTKYVALCDGDDFWTDSSKLQRQVDFLDNNKDFTICFHKVKIFFEDGSQEPVLHPQKIKSNLTLSDLCQENFMTANTVVYRWIYRKKNSFISDFPKNIVPGDYYVHLMHAARGKIHYINRQMSCYRRNSQGMWWMISQPNLRNEFYYKNGQKMLRFYDCVEEKLSLNYKAFLHVKSWLISEVLKSNFVLHKFRNVKQLYNTYHPKYSEVFSEYYKTLNLKNKFIYVLITDPFYKFRRN